MNKYGEQVWVLPEDDANRQIANGFVLEPSVKPRNVSVQPVAGGWSAVRDSFERQYNGLMKRSPKSIMVLLVDFDGRGDERKEEILSGVDPTLRDRVFVLGIKSEPERLKTELGLSFEKIGRALAKECADETRSLWEHPLVAHNGDELERMVPVVRKIVFG